ncbi:hypothetical protein CSB45_09430 [candidate division KSB3 bacterium]|uniref:Dienelactone hydrolase domain-containing protein n=1 Tax=candidate division KSB3 bacterium TaxID=2044937 RepID=A0A2G6E4I0_9BACT|nr:MAG: hypothetical protein CSB45_09430 [candidate division KSB3 bacterium]PIE29454.1 MAG: hypothetical protein CSA57_08645 [candidate division KSB3 bacterium]
MFRSNRQLPLFLIALCAVFLMSARVGGSPEKLDMRMEEVSFSSADGANVSGSWIVPVPPPGSTQKQRWPVVVLLHDYGMNRRDWNVLIPDLIQAKFAVLALDLREHGQQGSVGAAPASSESMEYALKSGVSDVKACLKWLKSQKNVDAGRIGLAGIGIGSEITYLSSGFFKKKIKAAVVICPSYSAVVDWKFAGVEPQGILFCSASKSQQGMAMFAAQTLANFTKAPKRTIEYNSAACGIAMFYKHPGIKRAILDWMAQL